SMRLSPLLLAASLVFASPALAQKKPPAGGESVRYFEFSNELFEDLQDDGFLRETRQGGRVVSAVLDVCHAVSATSGRKDRFVVNLRPEGGKLVGTGESQEEKVPIRVALTRTVSGKTFNFEGTITRGNDQKQISVTEKSDESEAEFRENGPAEDVVQAQPKDFTEVSPGTVGAQVDRKS